MRHHGGGTHVHRHPVGGPGPVPGLHLQELHRPAPLGQGGGYPPIAFAEEGWDGLQDLEAGLEDGGGAVAADLPEQPFLVAQVVLQGGRGKGQEELFHQGGAGEFFSCFGLRGQELPGVQVHRRGHRLPGLGRDLHLHVPLHPGLAGEHVTGLHFLPRQVQGGGGLHLAPPHDQPAATADPVPPLGSSTPAAAAAASNVAPATTQASFPSGRKVTRYSLFPLSWASTRS